MNNSVAQTAEDQLVQVPAGSVTLEGNLSLPEQSRAIVLFAHGSGSSRHSPRNRYVARVLNEAKLATLLIDLLMLHEEVVDARTAQLRFDIDLLAERLVDATDWLTQFPDTKHLRIGYFGAGGGRCAPRCGARDRLARRPSRFGWCGLDARSGSHVVDRRRTRRPGRAAKPASADAAALKWLVIVPGATHLFEEPGALDEVARLARDWFQRHLDV
jgi:hypothetical protein